MYRGCFDKYTFTFPLFLVATRLTNCLRTPKTIHAKRYEQTHLVDFMRIAGRDLVLFDFRSLYGGSQAVSCRSMI